MGEEVGGDDDADEWAECRGGKVYNRPGRSWDTAGEEVAKLRQDTEGEVTKVRNEMGVAVAELSKVFMDGMTTVRGEMDAKLANVWSTVESGGSGSGHGGGGFGRGVEWVVNVQGHGTGRVFGKGR